jgi:hypothetical protein
MKPDVNKTPGAIIGKYLLKDKERDLASSYAYRFQIDAS